MPMYKKNVPRIRFHSKRFFSVCWRGFNFQGERSFSLRWHRFGSVLHHQFQFSKSTVEHSGECLDTLDKVMLNLPFTHVEVVAPCRSGHVELVNVVAVFTKPVCE